MRGVRLDGVQTCPVARRQTTAGAVLAGLLLGSMSPTVPAVPALAVERVVAGTADRLSPGELSPGEPTPGEPTPGELTISPGDMVVLINQDAPLGYRATSTSGSWTSDSGLAAPLPVLAPTPAGPSPRAAGPPQVSPTARLAVAGDLPGSGSPRGLGLPAVLAAVLVLGVASLLVRVLLAEPAPRRRAADTS